jgi:hypothetical protein
MILRGAAWKLPQLPSSKPSILGNLINLNWTISEKQESLIDTLMPHAARNHSVDLIMHAEALAGMQRWLFTIEGISLQDIAPCN